MINLKIDDKNYSIEEDVSNLIIMISKERDDLKEELSQSNTRPTTINGKHVRFDKLVWAFKKDFTSALAKCLVSQSPYTVPENLEKIIIEFNDRIPYDFDENGMVEVNLTTMTTLMNEVLESMSDVMALNERKNGREGFGFSSRYSKNIDPDDDFIDIMAIAQNITCEFADREDAQCWLDRK